MKAMAPRSRGIVVVKDPLAARPVWVEDAAAVLRHSSPAFASSRDHMEVQAWRLLGEDLAPYVDRMLAAQGDAAEPELIRLQHRLTELRRLRPAAPAVTSPFPPHD